MESMTGWEVIMTTIGVIVGAFGAAVIIAKALMWFLAPSGGEEECEEG